MAPQQTEVDAFDIVNLYLRYACNGEGLFKQLSFTVNVDNLLDQDPPEFRGVTSTSSTRGFTNGNMLGRLYQLGIEKKF